MAYNRWLAHHGVKGQKWGERNGPPYPLNSSISDGHKLIKSDGSPQSTKHKPTPPNTTYVKNHKGPMYFISEKELDGQTLEPRIVDNYFTKNGYEDSQTKRISFAPDVGKCLSGLSQNVKGKQFNVYVPDVEDGIDVYKPNSKAVPDAEITQEMWVTDPVKVKKLGSITCTGDTGEDGHKFKYGDKTAELYDWNYKWDQNTVFVSGSSKTQDESSGYYRKDLPKDIQKQLDDYMRKGNRIIVGDAPGIDRQVQDYLNSKKYQNVEVYGPGKEVRYTANSKWKTNPIDDPDHETGSKEWLAKKDIAMTEAADEGLAIVLDEGAKATRKNVQRLSEGGKGVRVYSLNKDGNDTWEDDWDRKWNTSYASKDVKKANDIYKTLSKQEKFFLTAEENSKRYVSREEYGKKGTNAYSLIEQYKDTPVSVIDIWKNDRGGADVSIAVRNDSKYRHKGYASRALENGLKYFYDHPEIEYLIWGVNSQNRPSIELAKKYGFYLYDKRDDGWETYTLDQKKEVKHAMAYNRWMYSDELYHHGVKDQKWGERNGPPYPLDSSLSDGSKLLPKATGSPQTKKKYKTSEKTAYQRKKRQEKNESSPDYQEKYSVGAELKRKYRAFKKQRAEDKRREEEYSQKEDRDWKNANERLESLGLSEDDAAGIIESVYGRRGYGVPGMSWGRRPGMKTEGEELNEAIDEYLAKKDKAAKQQAAARDAAKEHGTAEEVMKFRDTFSKEEWDSIASRLESEARVRKLLDKPLQSFDSGGNKQNQNSGNSSNQSKTVNAPENSKLKKIYEKGTAREVYQNRDKFTVEQLEAIEKRLTAEEKIGKLANNQVFITPDRVKKLEQVRDLLKVVGDMATTANTISKAFGGDSGKNKGDNNNNNKNKGNDSGESKRTTVVVEETKKDGTVKKTTTTDSTDKGPTAWLDKRKKKE